ncbi:MAG: hypothetical protein A2086_00700 [Spirochaetes bacterium GWD1_27_9]|nr:MAG: hypothetical protein A2Y34_08495 [Spirochaetes bacterium GWC1_27_15]OHD32529.1 MAG: hypothetical protein A2086_00700 [Spirochaetes bacterium GWD1_27_9]
MDNNSDSKYSFKTHTLSPEYFTTFSSNSDIIKTIVPIFSLLDITSLRSFVNCFLYCSISFHSILNFFEKIIFVFRKSPYINFSGNISKIYILFINNLKNEIYQYYFEKSYFKKEIHYFKLSE